MSSNFANTQTQPTYKGPGYEDLTTYYNANTGYLNSGATHDRDIHLHGPLSDLSVESGHHHQSGCRPGDDGANRLGQ